MAEVGAIASVIAIAQLGVNLSIGLYSIADTIGSANKDVRRIAKDIALFSAVLKDLGTTLERAKSSGLYRKDAFDTAQAIVKECEVVFQEIQKKSTMSTNVERPLEGNIALPTLERLKWVFRKERVASLRASLESLKTTILILLAVMSIAENYGKGAKALMVRSEADELVALKSLLMANETATEDLRDLYDKGRDLTSGTREDGWQPGPIAIAGVGMNFQQAASGNTSLQMSSCSKATQKAAPGAMSAIRLQSSPAEDFAARYRRIWGQVDQLELALKKLDIARWERERIEKNMHMGRIDPVELESKRGFYVHALAWNMKELGIAEEDAAMAIESLIESNHRLGHRMEVSHKVHSKDISMETLNRFRIPFQHDKHDPDFFFITRWVPEYFEDILWAHTLRLLELRKEDTQAHAIPVVIDFQQQHQEKFLMRKRRLASIATREWEYEKYDLPVPRPFREDKRPHVLAHSTASPSSNLWKQEHESDQTKRELKAYKKEKERKEEEQRIKDQLMLQRAREERMVCEEADRKKNFEKEVIRGFQDKKILRMTEEGQKNRDAVEKERKLREEAVEKWQREQREKADKEKKEEEEKEAEYKERLKRDFGLSDKQVSKVVNKENPAAMDLKRRTYTKIARRHVSLETLRFYDLPFKLDDYEPETYVLVKRWVPEYLQERLWEHTLRIREERRFQERKLLMEREEEQLIVRKKKVVRARRRKSYKQIGLIKGKRDGPIQLRTSDHQKIIDQKARDQSGPHAYSSSSTEYFSESSSVSERHNLKRHNPAAVAIDKSSIFLLDTDLNDMEGIIRQPTTKTPPDGSTSKGVGLSDEPRKKPDEVNSVHSAEWRAPESWAVRPAEWSSDETDGGVHVIKAECDPEVSATVPARPNSSGQMTRQLAGNDEAEAEEKVQEGIHASDVGAATASLEPASAESGLGLIQDLLKKWTFVLD